MTQSFVSVGSADLQLKNVASAPSYVINLVSTLFNPNHGLCTLLLLVTLYKRNWFFSKESMILSLAPISAQAEMAAVWVVVMADSM
jgi:hypothetical protein